MQKTCSIDIDGVLNYYPDSWISFLDGKGVYVKNIDKAKAQPYEQYTRLKKEYRRSQEKRHQPPRMGAVDFTKQLREKGYKIIIKTSRPINEHPHLENWTYLWLLDHNFTFDEVVFNRFHPTQIIKEQPTLEFIVDDNPEIIDAFKNEGVKTFLFTGDFDEILENLDENSDNYITP